MLWNTCITLMIKRTIFNSLYLCFFMSALMLLLEFVLRFPRLLSRVLRKPVIWIFMQFIWLVTTWCGSWCGKSWNGLLIVLYPFFFCLLAHYIYAAPLRIFFTNFLYDIGLLLCCVFGVIFAFLILKVPDLFTNAICEICFTNTVDARYLKPSRDRPKSLR